MQLRWLGMVLVSALALGACGDDSGGSGGKDAGVDAGNSNAGTGSTPQDAAVPVKVEKCDKMPMCKAPDTDIAAFLGPKNKPIADLLSSFGSAGLQGAGLSADPCCTDDGTCGVTSSMLTGGNCVEQDQEGKADTACPNYEFKLPDALTSMAGSFLGDNKFYPITFKGCCRPDNKCGLEPAGLGVGCVERTALTTLASMGASMVDAGSFDAGAPLESIGCMYEPATGSDGGTEDAGR